MAMWREKKEREIILSMCWLQRLDFSDSVLVFVNWLVQRIVRYETAESG